MININTKIFSLSLIAAAVASQVQAQAPVLEEVIVTAQKRTQSAQDIGISIAALSGNELRTQNIINTTDLAKAVPNLDIFDVTGGGVPVIVVRGVGLQNFRVNDTPTTSFYIDEVYQTSVAMAGFTMFDLGRVEILRGPQGGLYGRNAVGGAIQVISEAPSHKEASGYAELGYGEDDRVSAEGAYGAPLTDKLAFRVAGRVLDSDDTYYESVSGNFDHGEVNTWGARGQLLFTPNDSTELLLKLHGGRDESETPLLRAVGVYQRVGANVVPDFADGALFNYAGVNPSLDNICAAVRSGGRDDRSCETLDSRTVSEQGVRDEHDSASSFSNELDNEWWGVSLIARFDIGEYTLTSISAYDDFEHGRDVDFDAVETVQQHITYNSDIDSWSQEFRLAYESDSFAWIAGINYAEGDLEEDTALEGTSGLVPLAFGGLTRATQPYEQDTEMFSAYGHADIFLNDAATLTLELRYTDEDKSFEGGVILPQVAPDYYLSFADDDKDFQEWSGKVGLEYRLEDNTLLYGSISRGYKSGGFFGGFATSSEQLKPFDSETIISYEAGFKSELLDRTLRLNGALFYYDREDIQANATDPSATVPIKRLTNIGDGETLGGELEATWLASEYFQLSLGLGYADTEITDSDLLVGDIYSTGLYSPEDARLPNTPEWSTNVVASYQRPVTERLSAGLAVEYSWRSDQDLSLKVLKEEESVLEEDSYGLTNIRVTLEDISAGWHVRAFVENAFDEEYRTVGRSDTLGGIYELYGSPRIWGVSVGMEF